MPATTKTLKVKKQHRRAYTGGAVALHPNEELIVCLNEEQIIHLAKWVVKIEEYYTQRRGVWTPMDVEWALDGLTGEMFIVQARPETIHSQREDDSIIEFKLDEVPDENRLIIEGIAVGDRMGAGKVHRLYTLDGRDEMTEGAQFRPQMLNISSDLFFSRSDLTLTHAKSHILSRDCMYLGMFGMKEMEVKRMP